jgi:hypothetical protein
MEIDADNPECVLDCLDGLDTEPVSVLSATEA